MKFRLVAILVVLVMIGLVGNAFAQMMGGGMGMHGGDGKGKGHGGMMVGKGSGGHFLHLVYELDLTDEQQKAIETMHFNHWKEVVRKEADLKVTEIELQEIFAQEPVKMSDAEKKIRAIAGYRADLEIMHLKEREAVKAILTPEQLEKLNKELRAERHEIMIGKGGIGMHDGKRHGRLLSGYSDNDSDDNNDRGHETENDEDGKETKGH